MTSTTIRPRTPHHVWQRLTSESVSLVLSPSNITPNAILPEIIQSPGSSHGYFPSTSAASHVIAADPTSPLKMSQKSFDQHDEGPAEMDHTHQGENTLQAEIQYRGAQNQSVAWHEVRNLREEILVVRSQVREKRAELRRMEAAKAEADNLLFKRMVNRIHLGEDALPGMGQKTLHELMDDCQRARNAYGPEEYECTVLEDRLSRLEFKLNRLEKPFFSETEQPRPPLMLVDNATDPVLAHDGTNTWSIADDEFDEPNYHPSVTKFLSKQGDLDLLHERRDNLLDEKRALGEEKESRGRFGMTLNEDDQAWLDGSQAEYDSLAKDIDILEKELVELKLYCVSRGLIDEDGEPTEFEALEAASFHGEEGLNSGAQTSESFACTTVV
ncbi:hypothetical protein BKA64DRAFT_277525 [Cadophora sp. MPI-SDFR-AT-0126]|nr:hypothetical protein BKA64DRAFT_277525 [Leotiomycetes sp. MPI-SDFR-AT-0126]